MAPTGGVERMAFADEVIRFFDSTVPSEVWSRSVWRRTLMRAMHPDRWLDVLSGAMWKGERAADNGCRGRGQMGC